MPHKCGILYVWDICGWHYICKYMALLEMTCMNHIYITMVIASYINHTYDIVGNE